MKERKHEGGHTAEYEGGKNGCFRIERSRGVGRGDAFHLSISRREEKPGKTESLIIRKRKASRPPAAPPPTFPLLRVLEKAFCVRLNGEKDSKPRLRKGFVRAIDNELFRGKLSCHRSDSRSLIFPE